jgi:hypothetical protein
MANHKEEKFPDTNSASKGIRHLFLWGTDIGEAFSSPWAGDAVEGGVIGTAAGAVIAVAVGIGVIVYRKARGRSSYSDEKDYNNPWNARLKAGVVLGEGIGRTLFAILLLVLAGLFADPALLVLLGGAIVGCVGGLIALSISSWSPESGEKLKPEFNPASEKIRSGAMFGVSAGVLFGALLPISFPALSFSTAVLIGSGVGAFIFGVTAYFADDDSTQSPDEVKLMNPWAKRIRAGVQWGACLGILLGALLPELGIIVGGALFSVIGAGISLIVEPLFIHEETDEDYAYKTANAWVPRCRAGVAWFTSIGTLIGCFILPGPIGAAIGGGIGGLVGGFLGIAFEPLYIAVRRLLGEKLDNATLDEELSCLSGNSWSERSRTGTLIFAAIGALIGFFAFPPFGMFVGGAIGGIVGGIGAFLLGFVEKGENKQVSEDLNVNNSGYQLLAINDNGRHSAASDLSYLSFRSSSHQEERESVNAKGSLTNQSQNSIQNT